jgi:hypothetical protein
MEIIKVKDIIKVDFAVTTDDGDSIFKMLDHHFEKGEKIVLDFSEIYILTTAFLNAAIGQLYSKYNSEDISAYLKLENVNNSDKILFKTVTQRAKEYFANKEEFEKNTGDAIYGTD